ncbi:MAG: TfoX/Sxy family protein [Candidatus Methanoplasma sp.]|jgi:TfoX/Sxy family transcriptional regulator of competence genes|nr:TfoX/Sxy family protein [Candidatus Methanoplasma sp.]
MASSQEFVDKVCSNISEAGAISYRKMMGEYVIYCDGKVIGLAADNTFYVKVTDGGWAMLGGAAVFAPPYPGAKDHFVIDAAGMDRALLNGLASITYDELPAPKPKKKKK